MKQRPNISIQKKSNGNLDYLRYLATENIQPNVSAPTIVSASSKTKSKPNINIQPKNLDVINKHRINMINYAVNEKGINPDLLIEYNDKYVLSITSYELITNNETPTAKDFDIYCNGLKVDISTYDVKINSEIVITIQKSEAVDDHFDTNNFEIVSRFTLAYMINDNGDYLITDGLDDIII